MQSRLKRWLLGTAFAAVLALAFMAYLRPSFVFDLANRIVMCF
ncbi:hypothetical protein [Noviherbaspirillum massiliense]|nr:hypothetical protein [Noviherbaspirillum massiliense]